MSYVGGRTIRAISVAPDGWAAYVISTDWDGAQVIPVALPAGVIGKHIPIAKGAQDIAIPPDGSMAYVAIAPERTIVPIDLPAGTVGIPIEVGLSPSEIAITGDGGTVVVIDCSDSPAINTVNLRSGVAREPMKLDNRPVAVAISPNGRKAFLANLNCTITPLGITGPSDP